MNRIAVSATIGILAGAALAGAYFGAPYAGYQIAPASLMVIAASVAFGSAISVAAVNLAKAAEKAGPSGLMAMQLKRANNMVEKFPGRYGALELTIRADQKIDQLEVMLCHRLGNINEGISPMLPR